MKLTWEQFIVDIGEVAEKVRLDNFTPDIILAIARGGWIPTRFLSDCLNVKNIASIGIKYIDVDRTKLTTYSLPQIPDNLKRILIVEDILESGKSLEWAMKYYKDKGFDIKTASCYITACTSFLPNYYLCKIDMNTKFPWEECV